MRQDTEKSPSNNVVHTVVRCCKLNYTQYCDEHLFGQVSTCTGHYHYPLHICAPVKLRLPFKRYFDSMMLRL